MPPSLRFSHSLAAVTAPETPGDTFDASLSLFLEGGLQSSYRLHYLPCFPPSPLFYFLFCMEQVPPLNGTRLRPRPARLPTDRAPAITPPVPSAGPILFPRPPISIWHIFFPIPAFSHPTSHSASLGQALLGLCGPLFIPRTTPLAEYFSS